MPARKQVAAEHARKQYGISERRACRLIGLVRSTNRRKRKGRGDEDVRARLGQLARERRRFGYRRLTALLRREGRRVNHKGVYRLYRDMGLAMQRRIRRHGPRRLTPEAWEKVRLTRPNRRWAMISSATRSPTVAHSGL